NYVAGQKIDKIKGRDGGDPFLIYKSRWLSLLYNVPLRMHDGQYLLPVLPPNIACEQNDKLLENHLACTNKNCLPYADNRAFVWTAAIVEGGGCALAEQYGGQASLPWEFGHWCRLLNVDRPGFSPENSTDLEKKWAKERTYQRWAEWGTWYGYSYHSSAMLAAPLKEPPLWRYFGEMYFDQILLLLYLRITLFAFSRELTRINQSDRLTPLRNELSRLRLSFTKFTNLYQPPLISNQQQGLEMYAIARKSMGIDDLFEEVKEKISGTDEFIEMKDSGKVGRTGMRWTVIAVLISFVSLHKLWFPFVKDNLSLTGLLLVGVLSFSYWLIKQFFRI
ncbi:MAG: hypothetical protein D3923_07165, partial [Candidatus Electrothrix sp. AR3]|nr:hypothetical protein [Candidatus Electrothrix sp. AR3]